MFPASFVHASRRHRFVYTLAVLSVISVGVSGHANNKQPEICSEKSAQKGVDMCSEAFQRGLDYNKQAIVNSPKRRGCCLSNSVHYCIFHSFIEAKCKPTDPEYKELVLELVRIKQKDFQVQINREANYLGNAVCKNSTWSACGFLVNEYNVTMEEIRIMNGSSALGVLPIMLYFLLILKPGL